MNENTFTSTSFCLVVFLFCLHFCLVRIFEVIRCIVKSLLLEHIFCSNTTEKKWNLKSVFWAPEFGFPNQYSSLPHCLNTSLTWPSNDLAYIKIGARRLVFEKGLSELQVFFILKFSHLSLSFQSKIKVSED